MNKNEKIKHLAIIREVEGENAKEQQYAYVAQLLKRPDLIKAKYLEQAEKEIRENNAAGVEVLTYLDAEYPNALKECFDNPSVIYVMSSTPVAELFKDRMVAIVGTRDMSAYGKNCTEKLVCHFTKNPEPLKPVIVSGLAYGIDEVAHETALSRGLKTIAVLPAGLDRIYPIRHRELAERIKSTPGCALISQYPLGTEATAVNFLERNKTIAGLSESVVVIESKTKGGANVIARCALDYGRNVWAVPGRYDDIRSEGCNQLISEGLARMVTNKTLNLI